VMGRLVAIGLPLALAAFWLFPRLPSPLWGVPERAIARPGLSERMEPGEWLDLMSDDKPALRVRFDTPPPPPEQMYWRALALWNVRAAASGRPGLAGRMEAGEWLDLESDDKPALRVRCDTPPPPPEQMYGRALARWNYDGRAWTPEERTAALPPPHVEHVAG